MLCLGTCFSDQSKLSKTKTGGKCKKKTNLKCAFLSSHSGLEDQLLALVVAEERPDLEEAKNQLIVSNAKMKQELKEIEDKILEKLSNSEGSPVDDVDLIDTLEKSKIKSGEIKVSVLFAAQLSTDLVGVKNSF